MVANPLPDNDDKGLTVVQPASQIDVAKTAFNWLSTILHDENGRELVKGATAALTDLNGVFMRLLQQSQRDQETIVALDAAARTLKDQRDTAIFDHDVLLREYQDILRRGTKIRTEEIARWIEDGILRGNYGNGIGEDILNILTGKDDGRSLSSFTFNDLRDAIDRAADELAQAYDFPIADEDIDDDDE